ncbi:rod shape-determining protein MreC [Campylobacter mucosalis]|uniref:rod shape-determining protein MreC n=1 Tax=Campylobacter mucosalis TaxID=202 RepID=UPI0004D90950|nr:rod shape-determining protein MreC [Campylobacter mucosalis]KEA45939.1 rod shape-determining protein MreC [Campylobacter mucosalis]QKF63650.1 rod shape-determining protein MreC [Campylobacter mucosalis]
MKTKILLFIFVIFLVSLSIYKGSQISSVTINFGNFVSSAYLNAIQLVKDTINEHFRQVVQINSLREQNAELERSATLLATFANELNEISKNKNLAIYDPKIKLVRTLGYVNISDYNKFYISGFKDYNASKIYGLIYQGNSAGVVASKDDKPVALLQNDPKSIFSVYIGDEKIPGIAHGNKTGVVVKFIPQWLSPKVGDEVFTSGLDGIFFGGVPVGRVVKILEESSYKSAVIEPYLKANTPKFLYVITKEK